MFAKLNHYPYTFSRSFFSEKKTKQSNPTVWSKFSTLSPCLLSDSPRYVSKCLEKITFVWRQGAAQQLRYRWFSKKHNQGLSERRVNAIRDALVKAGVTSDRIQTSAFGEQKPLGNESTDACWQRDRRVNVGFRTDTASR